MTVKLLRQATVTDALSTYFSQRMEQSIFLQYVIVSIRLAKTDQRVRF